ncbi:MAG TPA: S-layer homology domain-containing protein [Thermoanaerobaculia bacterium]|nr:S-layer homology domain-containing protein [Thermoanaerobaculia bacterium]
MRLTGSGSRSIALCLLAPLVVGGGSALLGVCGPFTDVAPDVFCPFVLEIFTLGITTGTTPSTYDPSANVSRLQMAAFLSRTVDRVLTRGGRRAALNQFWTIQGSINLALTTVGASSQFVQSDGADLWVGEYGAGTVARIRGSDGRRLETWTTPAGMALLPATGKVFVAGFANPGTLYRIDPSQPAGAATVVASTLGANPRSIAFDGSRIWTANVFNSISIVTPGAAIPWTVTTVTTGFNGPAGALYDGSNIWITHGGTARLTKLDSDGAILQTVTVGLGPTYAVFDGSNIWVANQSANSVSVVRASNGTVLTTLTGNGISAPIAAAFDGERVLITNLADSVSLYKAADLSVIGNFPTGVSTGPVGACSDGVNFWIVLSFSNKLARF